MFSLALIKTAIYEMLVLARIYSIVVIARAILLRLLKRKS